MTTENAVRIVAGIMILISLALAVEVNRWWLLLAAFVALNLIQSAFTGFCPAEMLLRKLGCKSCSSASDNTTGRGKLV